MTVVDGISDGYMDIVLNLLRKQVRKSRPDSLEV